MDLISQVLDLVRVCDVAIGLKTILHSSRMLKKGGGMAGTIPVLAQRAVSEDPRWTRAVGIIPATPIKCSSLRPCLGQGASWRAKDGRV